MKVLIVDHDEKQRLLLTELLRRFEDVEVIGLPDAANAFDEQDNGLYPVLCCCDMHMRGMSGIDLLRKFRSMPLLAKVPFVFITGATERATVASAIKAGAAGYILKPFSVAKARASLERILRRVRARYSEPPHETEKRLDISARQLSSQLKSLKQEIADARPLLRQYAEAGKARLTGEKLASLHKACLNFGLWHAGSIFDHLRALTPAQVDRILQEIESIVAEQLQRATLDADRRQMTWLRRGAAA